MDGKKLLETECLIEEISDHIRHIIKQKLPNTKTEEREDISQEVKFKIWKMISRGKKINNLRSYLWRVVFTTAVDILETKIKFTSFEEKIEPDYSNPLLQSQDENFAARLEKKEFRLHVEKTINDLSPNRRLVIKMHLTGMNIREIAEFLNWSESKTNHLYYRGVEDLRKQLRDKKSGDPEK